MKREPFIPGIYNTCDYWCERCAFTRRCRNFSMRDDLEREARGEPSRTDAANAAFWDRLADELRGSAAFGPTAPWTDDTDVHSDLGRDPEWEAREEARHRAVDAHPIFRMAQEYMRRVHEWLKGANTELQQVAAELKTAAGSGVGVHDLETQARDIGEMIEVIAWYHTLLPPKLGRATGGLLEKDDPGLSDLRAACRAADADGSAKVALIAIERSMAAWLRLREFLPERKDLILELLALLTRLRNRIHADLPGAAAFLRPGFDPKD